MRAILFTILLLAGSCKSARTEVPAAPVAPAAVIPPRLPEIVVAEGDPRPLDYGPLLEISAEADGGATTATLGAIFQRGDIEHTKGVITLHVQGISIEPGTEAEVYFTSHVFSPLDYIGSIATVYGSPSYLGEVILEVNDFETDGQKYTARSSLQAAAHFGLTFVVKHGKLSAKKMVLVARNK